MIQTAPRPACCLLALLVAGSAQAADAAAWREAFREPPNDCRPVPFWHINGAMTGAGIAEQMAASQQQSGFGGVAVLPVGGMTPAYLSDDYFARYGDILAQARRLGMSVIFYDDINFPSGSAGGKMKKLHPDDLIKRLDKTETELTGPASYDQPLPDGVLMSAVAMETTTRARVDLTAQAANGRLAWQAPAGQWKVMVFTCVPSTRQLVDYLDPQAVDAFFGLTYEEYHKRFPEHFGTTIRMSFFDDVGFYATPRPWTAAFNTKFKATYGYDPAPLYPALWYDIGPATASARVALFGFRAELLAEGYPRTAGAWARAHGIRSSGHPPGNYDPCPVDMNCDIVKFYRHTDIPLTDAIFFHGHGRDGFKLISSAADSYDRPLVATEVYGAFAEKSFDRNMLYRAGMELFARGVNIVIPHGMWYDPLKVKIPPLISHFSDKLRPELPDYSRWVARCCFLLQGGRRVSEVAMLYPIASLEAWYRMDPPEKRWGQYVPPESDYQAVGGMLTNHVHRDFTFLHPDILEKRCRLDGATLRLDNPVTGQDYRVVVIPGGKVIPWSSLQRIKAFHDQGGKVVATTCLPSQSAEAGHDTDVQAAITDMFGSVPEATTSPPCRVRIEVAGSTIRTFIKGVLVDTTTDATHTRGRVGFRESDHECAGFSRLTVTATGGQVLFHDDFRSGLGQWTDAGSATARDGWLTVADNQAMRSVAGAEWTDYTLEVDIQDLGQTPPAGADKVNHTIGLVFRSSDAGDGYMWQIDPVARKLRPHRQVKGGWQLIKQVDISGDDWTVTPFTTHAGANGGTAWFAPTPTVGTLQAILDQAHSVPDVRIEGDLRITSGNGRLSCIHKVKDGNDLYFFANSSDDPIDTWVRLKGRSTLQVWDPHTGTTADAEQSHLVEGGVPVTRVHLALPAVRSLFLVGSGM